MRPRADLILVGITVLWGSTFVVTKDLVREIAPLPYLTFRFGLAAIVMLVLYRRRLPGSQALVRDGILLGLLNSVGLLLQVFGQAYTTVAKSSFITSLNTPLTPLVALVIYGTRPSRPQRAAVAIASGGLLLLTWPGSGARWNAGDLITIGCAILYAFTIVELARRTARSNDLIALSAVQVIVAALLFGTCLIATRIWLASVPFESLPEMIRLEARPFHPSRMAIVEMVYMALVCTVVTFAGQTWAMSKLSATHAAVIFALEPVFATAMAIGVSGTAEWPGARGGVGALLVMVAVLVSEIRLPGRRPAT